MEFYTKGQLSYLILTCLLDRDFYGLDIISEISARSNGKINLKKPSVYSNLKRMEKQGYVSSYLKSSDYGPNRKYHSLTEKGRNFYKELKSYFDYNKIDVFRDFVDEEVESDNFLNNDEFTENVDSPASTENIDNQEEFFDFSSVLDDVNNTETNDLRKENTDEEPLNQNENNFIISDQIYTEKSTEENVDTENLENNVEVYDEKKLEEDKQDLSSKTSFTDYSETNVINAEINNIENDKKFDDAKFLSNEQAESYNQKLFDISKDINKIKRKRSFADEQIAISEETEPLYYANEKKKANLEDLKNSLLENKNKYNNQSMINYETRNKLSSLLTSQAENKIESKIETKIPEQIKDDARLITGRMDESEIAKAKKIDPPKLKIVSENTKDTRLPAPNRDTTIDPSHREILNRLYSMTKDGTTEEVRDDAIYDYKDLKKFYETQNITFDIYKKTAGKISHNTNLIYLTVSVISFIASILCSTLLYVIFVNTGLINIKTNFLYILLPALLLIDIVYRIYNYKVFTSQLPNKLTSHIIVWGIFALVSSIVVGLNLIFGVATKPFHLFATSLILPIILAAILIPVRYYITRFSLIKYWK